MSSIDPAEDYSLGAESLEEELHMAAQQPFLTTTPAEPILGVTPALHRSPAGFFEQSMDGENVRFIPIAGNTDAGWRVRNSWAARRNLFSSEPYRYAGHEGGRASISDEDLWPEPLFTRSRNGIPRARSSSESRIFSFDEELEGEPMGFRSTDRGDYGSGGLVLPVLRGIEPSYVRGSPEGQYSLNPAYLHVGRPLDLDRHRTRHRRSSQRANLHSPHRVEGNENLLSQARDDYYMQPFWPDNTRGGENPTTQLPEVAAGQEATRTTDPDLEMLREGAAARDGIALSRFETSMQSLLATLRDLEGMINRTRGIIEGLVNAVIVEALAVSG